MLPSVNKLTAGICAATTPMPRVRSRKVFDIILCSRVDPADFRLRACSCPSSRNERAKQVGNGVRLPHLNIEQVGCH